MFLQRRRLESIHCFLPHYLANILKFPVKWIWLTQNPSYIHRLIEVIQLENPSKIIKFNHSPKHWWHIPKGHMSFKSLPGGTGTPPLPWLSVPGLDNSFNEEMFCNIHLSFTYHNFRHFLSPCQVANRWLFLNRKVFFLFLESSCLLPLKCTSGKKTDFFPRCTHRPIDPNCIFYSVRENNHI